MNYTYTSQPQPQPQPQPQSPPRYYVPTNTGIVNTSPNAYRTAVTGSTAATTRQNPNANATASNANAYHLSSAQDYSQVAAAAATVDSLNVLATHFVPSRVKQGCVVNQVLKCHSLPEIDTAKVYQSLVPIMAGTKPSTTGNGRAPTFRSVNTPLADSEIVYALRERRPRTNYNNEPNDMGRSSNPGSPVPGGRSPSRATEELEQIEHNLLSIDNISSISQGYMSRWRSILNSERRARLDAHEKCTQYATTIYPIRGVTDYAVVVVPGLTDVNPAIQVGDSVSVMGPLDSNPIGATSQPINKVTVPQPQYYHQHQQYPGGVAQQPPEWGMRKVEIRAAVSATNRLRSTVTITWVSGQGSASNNYVHLLHPALRYNVRFIPSRTTLDRCLDALSWSYYLPPAFADQIFFPTKDAYAEYVLKHENGLGVEENNKTNAVIEEAAGALNKEQRECVFNVLNRTTLATRQAATAAAAAAAAARKTVNGTRNAPPMVLPPYLIVGPAGTGKTMTVASLIRALLIQNPEAHILACAPSSSAADTLAMRLTEKPHAHGGGGGSNGLKGLNNQELFRLNATERPPESLPSKLLPFVLQSTTTGRFILHEPQKLLSFRVIVCTCSEAAILVSCGITNQSLRSRRCSFANQLEAALAKTGMKPAGNLGQNTSHFSHLIIDEAAQAEEPLTLIPISVVMDCKDPQPSQIVLCGDPMQLGPITYSKLARKSGLERSLFERLMKLAPYTTTDSSRGADENTTSCLSVLLRNYRSHSAILMLPSSLFYADMLIPCSNAPNRIDLLEAMRSPSMAGGGSSSRNTRRVYAAALLADNNFNINENGMNDNGINDNGPTTLTAMENPNFLSHHPIPDILKPKRTDWPIVFWGVKGVDKFDLDQNSGLESWSNREEALQIAQIIRSMPIMYSSMMNNSNTSEGAGNGVMNNRPGGNDHHQHHIGSEHIGVMAPFRGQVALIRNVLRQEQLGGINVGSIEDYQGMERPVVLLSTVRATPKFLTHDLDRALGVFFQPKRANVALTRAMSLMVVVGNPRVLALDPTWVQFLWFCYRNQTWFGEPFPELYHYSRNESSSKVEIASKATTTSATTTTTSSSSSSGGGTMNGGTNGMNDNHPQNNNPHPQPHPPHHQRHPTPSHLPTDIPPQFQYQPVISGGKMENIVVSKLERNWGFVTK